MVIKNSLKQSHDIIKNVVGKGDLVIDATAGNGNDTLMLAQLVGDEGKVYSFDIQDQAISNTIKKLQENGLLNRVSVVKDGHQNMDKYVKDSVKAVMFNLGYLPGGDHNIATKGETTIIALKKAMELLMIGGIITIVIYYGGDSGFEEKDILLDFLPTINSKQYTVMKTEFINQPNCPPILVCIEKINVAN
ncbi:MAG TPA: methyltransferase domain-containing protein [Clostridiaceae bacterium]|nr:methyltransferase domain-containing protein [Clostridiaceae bacterium]